MGSSAFSSLSFIVLFLILSSFSPQNMEDLAYEVWLEHLTLLLGAECKGGVDETDAVKALMQVICDLWSGLPEPSLQSKCDRYVGAQAPPITIEAYGQHLAQYLDPSPAAVLGANVYISRIQKLDKLHLSSRNIHRLLLTALMVSIKFFDDM